MYTIKDAWGTKKNPLPYSKSKPFVIVINILLFTTNVDHPRHSNQVY